MKGRKREIKIDQLEFIHWYFEKEEILGLGIKIVEDLKCYGTSSTEYNLDSFFANIGYLPENLILNTEKFKDLIFEGEIAEGDLSELKPIWCEKPKKEVKRKIIPFDCPNCKKEMYLSEENILFRKQA